MKKLLAGKVRFLFSALGIVVLSSPVYAYPELIRHGLNSCSSCHFSPSGDGIVSAYGRDLASEYLRMGGGAADTGGDQVRADGDDSGEAVDQLSDFDFLHGAVRLPEWLNIGGDVRTVASSLQGPDINREQMSVDQAEVEVALMFNRIDLIAAGGRREDEADTKVEFASQRHYAVIKPSEDILFRIGRFFPAYGLGIAERGSVIKRDLGWGDDQESYNLEASYFRDRFELMVDGIFGRPDKPDLKREEGFSVKGILHATATHSLGLNAYQGIGENTERTLYGIYALLGFTPKLALLVEVDLQDVKGIDSVLSDRHGRALYSKISYEILQGVNLHAIGQQSFMDADSPSSLQNIVAIGLQMFPWPHLELKAQYERTRNPRISEDRLIDYASLEAHYYL